MTTLDLPPPTAPVAPTAPRRTLDFAVVTGAWALAVLAAAVFPLRDPRVARVALFIHLVSMAIGFGAVIMVDVYGVLWLLGVRTLAEVMALSARAWPAASSCWSWS